jgi:hypothetical protein
MTASVAGPSPDVFASWPERSIGPKSSTSSAWTTRAADAYARDLKRLSPCSSRNAPIWERTYAAVRGSMSGNYEGRGWSVEGRG